MEKQELKVLINTESERKEFVQLVNSKNERIFTGEILKQMHLRNAELNIYYNFVVCFNSEINAWLVCSQNENFANCTFEEFKLEFN